MDTSANTNKYITYKATFLPLDMFRPSGRKVVSICADVVRAGRDHTLELNLGRPHDL